jgi:hypothetical protein
MAIRHRPAKRSRCTGIGPKSPVRDWNDEINRTRANQLDNRVHKGIRIIGRHGTVEPNDAIAEEFCRGKKARFPPTSYPMPALPGRPRYRQRRWAVPVEDQYSCQPATRLR